MGQANYIVSLKDVARAAKVSLGTASQALRNCGDTSLATRERVQKVARKLGYTSDPMISRTMTYLRKRNEKKVYEPIAYLSGYECDKLPRKSTMYLKYMGVLKRATELGFEIIELPWKDYRKNPKVLEKKLFNRGIRGIIIGPQPAAHERLEIDWSLFASVALCTTIDFPVTSRVIGDHYQIVKLAITKLSQYGYRRIGFTKDPLEIERSDRLWIAGYRALMDSRTGLESIPELIHEFNEEAFLKWFRKYRPEAIIDGKAHHYEALLKSGFKVPEDCALVDLDPRRDGSPVDAQVDHEPVEVGRTAVNFISSFINRNEFGLPKHPKDTLIRGTWIDGKSAPEKICQNGRGA